MKKSEKIFKMLEIFKDRLGANTQLHQVMMLAELYRADPDPLSLKDLEVATGVSYSSVCKNGRRLGTRYRGGTAEQVGLELIDVVRDPIELRKKNVYLTRKGREMMQACADLL